MPHPEDEHAGQLRPGTDCQHLPADIAGSPLPPDGTTPPLTQASSSPRRDAARGARSQVRIVIAEDDPGSREYLQALLGGVGFTVIAAEDGQQALALVRRERPDLVITDLLMPNMDGFEFIRHLRCEPEVAGTRVILLSAGFQEQAGCTLGQALGGARFVPKPVEPKELLALVDDVLRTAGAPAMPALTMDALDDAYRSLLSDSLGRKTASLEQEVARSHRLESEARASEQRLASILATAMDAILTIDAAQRIVLFNTAAEAMFGCTAAEAIGSPVERFIPMAFRAAHGEHVRRFLAGGATVRAMGRLQSLLGRRANGEEFPLEASISKVQAGESVLATVVIRDISARLAAEAALQESEQRLRLAQQIGRIGTFDWNIATNDVGWSAEIAALYGLPAQGFESTYAAWRARIHPEDIAALEQRVRNALTTRSFEGEWRVLWPDGTEHWLAGRAVVYLDETGKPLRMVGVNIDITERKESEARILRAAQHDPLTGLPNRALLYEFVEHLLATIRRHESRAAILFVDLDRFKPINDTYGHTVGDAVLQEVAQRLSSCVREADLVGRLGGDEFVAVLAPIHGEEDAAKIARHFIERLGQPYLTNGLELQVSPSIGISLFPRDGDQVDDLIQRADAAMYAVKQNGRNAFQFFRADLKPLGPKAPRPPADTK